jgi:hypothetical protein
MSRLFHSLVVCGAGLTLLDCGGRFAEREKDDDVKASGRAGAASGRGSTGAASGTGGSASVGGGVGASGSEAVGGLSLGGFAGGNAPGGTTSAGGSGVIVLPGAQAQWVCNDELFACEDGLHEGHPVTGFQIATPCQVDPKRPTSAADCAMGESFGCLVGFIEGQTVLFNCECADPNLVGQCHCPATANGCWRPGAPHYCDLQQTVCGCAYTCILK